MSTLMHIQPEGHLCAQIEGVVPAGVGCHGVRPTLSLFMNTVSVSDHGNQGDQILLYLTGIWSQRSSKHHDSNHECNQSTGRECSKGNIILHWWHLRQWMYCVFLGGQKTLSISDWYARSQSLSKTDKSAKTTCQRQRRKTSLEERWWHSRGSTCRSTFSESSHQSQIVLPTDKFAAFFFFLYILNLHACPSPLPSDTSIWGNKTCQALQLLCNHWVDNLAQDPNSKYDINL